MNTVRLVTSSGDYVADIELPPFNTPPDVVVWGQRFFVRKEDNLYQEAFAWYHTGS